MKDETVTRFPVETPFIMPRRTFEIAPQGYRWPWSPLFIGTGELTAHPPVEELSNTTYRIDVDKVTEFRSTHVGLWRALKHWLGR